MTLLQPGWREATKTVNGVWLHVVEAGQAGKGSLDKHGLGGPDPHPDIRGLF